MTTASNVVLVQRQGRSQKNLGEKMWESQANSRDKEWDEMGTFTSTVGIVDERGFHIRRMWGLGASVGKTV